MTKATIDELEDEAAESAGEVERVDPRTLSLWDRIEKMGNDIERAVPEEINPVHFAQSFYQAVAYNPKLAAIARHPEPSVSATLWGAMFNCAQIGLMPGSVLGHVWLIPRWDKDEGANLCTFQLGYKGVITLARRATAIGSIKFGHAYSDEIIANREGTEAGRFVDDLIISKSLLRPLHGDEPPTSFESLQAGENGHRPDTLFYTVVELLDGGAVAPAFRLTATEAFAHYLRTHPANKQGYRTRGAWNGNYAAMAAISAFRLNAARSLPIDPTMSQALAHEGSIRRNLDIDPKGYIAQEPDHRPADEPEQLEEVTVFVEDEPEPLTIGAMMDYAEQKGIKVGDDQSPAEAIAAHHGVDEDMARAHVREWAGE